MSFGQAVIFRDCIPRKCIAAANCVLYDKPNGIRTDLNAADRAVRYKSDRRGTALNYKVVGEAMACMRACRKPISKDWKAEIEEDVARRGE